MEIKELMSRFPRTGKVEWIGIRPARRVPLAVLEQVSAIEGKGLVGDRYQSGRARQVTLIQHEHVLAVASLLGLDFLDPSLLRRNIVVSAINLVALKNHQFRVGDALLEYSGECHPCSRMEEILGEGGYNAMRGHGGITARIIKSGLIETGSLVQVIE